MASGSRSSGRRLKLLVGAVAGVAALTVLVLVVLATAGSSTYYYTVGEVLGKGRVTGVRVAGQLAAGSLKRADTPGGTTIFRLQDPGHADVSFFVTSAGAVPDTLMEGMSGEVVVEGDYDGEGYFSATAILTKCPSKYQQATEDKVERLEGGSLGE